MKKVIIVALIAVTLSFSACAHDLTALKTPVNSRGITTVTIPASANNNTVLPPTRVNAKAARDFLNNCKSATDVTWYNCEGKGTCAFYNLAGKKGRRFYDKQGNFVYNILTYSEQSLPPEIRDLVKRTYYLDYTIDKVDEVFEDDRTMFILNISDSKTLKTISIYNGDIFVLSDKNKSK